MTGEQLSSLMELEEKNIGSARKVIDNPTDFGLVSMETMFEFCEWADEFAAFSRSRALWAPYDDFEYYTTPELFQIFKNNKA